MLVEEIGSRKKRKKRQKGLWAAEALLRNPQGSCDDISFRLFFARMRNAGSVSEIIANSKLVRFHGPRKGAGGEIGRRGVF